MIGRRGFLGALLAATGVAALDPERALWRPGKLISVPKHVHVPKVHHLHSFYRVQWRDLVLPELPNLHNVHERYLFPAIAAIDGHIGELAHEAGGRPVQFLPHEALNRMDDHGVDRQINYELYGPETRNGPNVL